MLHTSRREESTVNEQQLSRWRTAAKAAIWIVCILVILGLAISVYGGYRYEDGWKWTGIVKNAHFHRRTLWDWLDLLIIPAVLAAGGRWFNQRQQARAEMSETQRAQDEALQAYLDRMSELLMDKDLHKQKGDYDEPRVTARAHTLAVLDRLDAKRKRTVLLFLREARLINRYEYCPPDHARKVTYFPHYVGLEGADLSGADLEGARLISTSGKEPISLKGANLEGAKLSGAILQGAELCEADLSKADLSGADLKPADLSGVEPKPTDVSETNLSHTDLSGANLSGATLRDADLSGSNLQGACKVTKGGSRRLITNEELAKEQIRKLEGATMPNGQKYEEWLEDRKDRKKDIENE